MKNFKNERMNEKDKNSNVFFEEGVEYTSIEEKTICILGYGNQGRSQALNLRDNKLKVIVGSIPDNSFKRAKEDGFDVYSIAEAVKLSDIVFLLIPDESMPKTYKNDIEANMKDGSTLVFASGYNIAFNLIVPSDKLNVIMIAPRMIGLGVRERFLTGESFFSFICVHQDATGDAKDVMLALSKGIGTLKKGGIEVSMKQEAILDLFNEQAFGPAFGRVLLTAIDVLLKNGLPAEAVLCEMFMSEEMSYTYKAMARIGIVEQVNLHSHTSQYGSMSRGLRYLGMGKELTEKFQKTFEEIDSGSFAKEWSGMLAKLKFKVIKYFATKQNISKVEKEVRKNLRLKEFKPSEMKVEEILQNKEMEKEIEEIKKMYEILD